MDCPQCHNNEISSSGLCLVCGYRLETPAQEVDESTAGSEPDIPQWRKELSERLQSIRQKKKTDEKEAPSIIAPAEPMPASQPPAEKIIVHKPAAFKNQRIPLTDRPVTQTPVPQQKVLAPVIPEKNPRDVEQLIDKAVTRRSSQPPQPPLPMSETAVPVRENPSGHKDKLILLSRTLAGLVDLMFIVLCTGAIIVASDLFSGIISLDSISYAICSALFLLIYLAYSIFFLSASTQTIGMMITDLRVVGQDRRRPCFSQVLGRCIGYLLSLFLFGIGLAWGLFDSENRCFHDRISHTQVIRI
jgi:uncharacterized RDD family membrane protein YckC